MSAALTLAVYLLCCKEMGQTPVFPGNKFFYNAVDDCSYAPSLADMNVWAATSEHAKNEAFNHTNGDVYVWKHFWPKLARYFGVEVRPNDPELRMCSCLLLTVASFQISEAHEWKATGEDQKISHNVVLTEWAKGKEYIWHRLTAKHGGNPSAFQWATWDFFDWAIGKAWYTFGTVSKARKFGWDRYDDSYDAWTQTFRSFENAGILPPHNACAELEVERPITLLPHPTDIVAARPARSTAAENGLHDNGVLMNGTSHSIKEKSGVKQTVSGLNFGPEPQFVNEVHD